MQTGFQSKIKNRMATRVNPDKTARYEPSHLDLHCLHRYLFWSARLKGLKSWRTCILDIYCRISLVVSYVNHEN